MDIRLSLKAQIPHKKIAITGSKSETNRLLLLKALYPNIVIENASESDDSRVMEKALSSGADVIDVHHAGTAMRFLTAYYATRQGREVVLTGSERMKERPIEELVKALNDLGAGIEYLEREGFPPLRIKGQKLQGGKVTVKADVSSQFITALLLIAPKLKQGIQIDLQGQITSRPYINMTLSLLKALGIDFKFSENVVSVQPAPQLADNYIITVESDWSSASYHYAIVALAPFGTQLTLSSFNRESLQGDSALPFIFKNLNVTTHFNKDSSLTITKGINTANHLQLNLADTPDLAQTIAVVCFGLGISCELTGLHTLKIKETDRLIALQRELTKFGAQITVTDNSLSLKPASAIKEGVKVETYNDHRMALAFAPLVATGTSFVIKDAEVVSKSYPGFWEELKGLGFDVQQV